MQFTYTATYTVQLPSAEEVSAFLANVFQQVAAAGSEPAPARATETEVFAKLRALSEPVKATAGPSGTTSPNPGPIGEYVAVGSVPEVKPKRTRRLKPDDQVSPLTLARRQAAARKAAKDAAAGTAPAEVAALVPAERPAPPTPTPAPAAAPAPSKPAENDFFGGTPAPAVKADAPASKVDPATVQTNSPLGATQPSEDLVRDKFFALVGAPDGEGKAMRILSEFGVTIVRDLPKDQYPAFYSALIAASRT